MKLLILLSIVGLLHSCIAQTSSTSTTPASLTALGGTGPGCLAYAASCGNSNMCCFYPSILCLPDVRNGTSCLSIFDVVNLNPSITGSNLGPLLTALGNSTSGVGAIQEIVQVNGNTVYNLTEVITPSPTPGLGSTLSLI